MKKIELILLAIQVPIDYLMLILAGILSYSIRFTPLITDIRPVIFDLPFSEFLIILLLNSIVWILIFAFYGLYNRNKGKRKKLIYIFLKVISASTFATTIIIIAFFFNQRLFNSRLIILMFWFSSIFLVFLGRIFYHYLLNLFYNKGLIYNKAILIGQDNNTKTLRSEFDTNKKNGLKIIRHFQQFNENVIDEIRQIIKHSKIDEIILADSAHNTSQINSLINFCHDHHLHFRYTASLYDTKLKNFEIITIAGIPLIEIKNTSLDGWGKIFKRVFDLIISSFLIIVFSPLFILISLVIKIDSPGDVILGFKRIGEKNKQFILYKFRSMIKDAHKLKAQMQDLNERNDGPLFKIKNDPRVTRFGKILRKYSLDELPQLFNVLKGEMSLVGPRPHEPEEVDKYKTHHKKLLSIKPGMTGLAAISGRSDLRFEEEVRLDTFYVENWSMILDLIILFKTPFIVLAKKIAY